MSQIYRVFAKALAKYMLKHLARLLPPQITGGVPGRSADQVWYAIQAQVEQCRFTKQQTFGFCLDIQKAFNAIPRHVALAAMLRAGIPSQIVSAWFQLLRNLKRTVKIAGNFSGLRGCTTGIPEGDPVSVPCMAIVCWVFYEVAARQHTQPWAYADNWEFLSSDINTFVQAIRHTKQLLDQWKMKLDLKKSWCWSVFPINSEDNESLSDVFGEGNFNMKSTAKDLGATMKYRKIQSIQDTRKRFDCAITRARRLIGLPLTLSERWRALLTSAMSVALYAIEIVPLGFDHFKLLRSALADVITKTWRQRNEHLACTLTHQGIADPEILAVKRCVRLFRKYIHTYPDVFQLTTRVMVATQIDTKNIHGPFGCLKRWFNKLGWQITQSGNIRTQDGLVFSLAYACPKHIDHLIDLAWERHVISEIQHRKGMSEIPSINFDATTRSLAKLSDVDQQIMVRYLTGSNVYGDSAKHWGSGNGECSFCMHEHDSQVHRICECPVFDDLRKSIEPTFEWMQTRCPFWPHLPAFPRAEREVTLRQMCALQPLNPLNPQEVSRPVCFDRFFTDGSCVNPAHPECSIATWAVVRDNASLDMHRSLVGDSLATGQIPETLTLVHSGFVIDQQNNDRAELTAILHAVAQSYWVEVYSDSEYAINTTGNLLDKQYDPRMHMTTNHDLICQLRRTIGNRTRDHIKLLHVRAHQDIASCQSSNEAYLALGNHCADRQAVAVWLHCSNRALRECASEIREFYQECSHHWFKLATFLTGMTKRISDMKYKPLHPGAQPLNQTDQGQSKFHQLIQWTVPEPSIRYVLGITQEQAQAMPHPSSFVFAVAAWLEKLTWPQTVAESDVGVTWLELLVDCVTSTATRVPRQKGKHRGYYLYEHDAGGLLSDTLNAQIVTFRSCVKLIATMLNKDVCPAERSVNLCKSLLVFPGAKPSTGLAGRPLLVSPEATFKSLDGFFAGGAYKGSSTTFSPAFPFDRSQPTVDCPIATCTDPCSLKRVASFIKVQLHFKKLNS